jgi:GT2 family glycosyltransferase
MKPIVSIIVIVKNDPGVATTLDGLRTIYRPFPVEVVVVDASKPEVLVDIRRHYPEVRWVQFTPSPGPKSSIPEQRNTGVRLAKGDIVVFIDDNCSPERDWLSNLVAPITRGGESITAGSTTATNPKTLANFNPAGKDVVYRSSAPTVNLAFTRQAFNAVGGFDESLHFGSDHDFTWRCIDRGYKIRYCPDARITHDWGTAKDEFKRSFKYGRAKFVLYTKHPERVRPFAEDMFVPMYLTYLALLPVSLWLPWYPLTIVIPMARNIKRRPFKTAAINLVFSLGFARQALATGVGRIARRSVQTA